MAGKNKAISSSAYCVLSTANLKMYLIQRLLLDDLTSILNSKTQLWFYRGISSICVAMKHLKNCMLGSALQFNALFCLAGVKCHE